MGDKEQSNVGWLYCRLRQTMRGEDNGGVGDGAGSADEAKFRRHFGCYAKFVRHRQRQLMKIFVQISDMFMNVFF